MIDFPVYIWRDMLPDFRAYVTKVAFPSSSAPHGDFDAFWRACRHLQDKAGWEPSEYTNLLQYAWESPKWRSRYAFQVAFQIVLGRVGV